MPIAADRRAVLLEGCPLFRGISQKGLATLAERANEVEQTHHALYSQALDAAKAGKDLPAAEMYVCEVCGHTVAGEAPDVCPVCGARHEKFTKID